MRVERLASPKRAPLLEPKNLKEIEARYAKYFDEIIDRLWVIISTTQKLKAGKKVNEYRSVDIDLCYLQLRKAFELIAFSSLLAHRLIDKSMKKITKEYHAEKILSYIKKLNPDYFPKPVAVQNRPDGTTEFVERGESRGVLPLAEPEYRNAYNAVCGFHLHANHQYERNADTYFLEHAMFLNDIAQKTLCLLSSHSLCLNQQYYLFCRISSPEKDGPEVKIARRIDDQIDNR